MESEIPNDILPDMPVVTPTEEIVSEDVTTPVSEEPGKEAPEAPESQAPEGYVPYSRFKEVNQKAKDLEKQLQDLQVPSTPEEEIVEDPSRVDALEKEIKDLRMDNYLNRYPELNDKREELADFLEENSTLPLERAILLFRAESGMITAPSRKGLETTVGGPKTAPAPKWSLEDIDKLRETDEKQWEKRMSAGEFDEALKGWKVMCKLK